MSEPQTVSIRFDHDRYTRFLVALLNQGVSVANAMKELNPYHYMVVEIGNDVQVEVPRPAQYPDYYRIPN